MNTGRVILTLMLLLIIPAAALAQGSIQLRSVAQVEKKVMNAEGKIEVKRVPAAKVVPGTEVIFSQHYENIGDNTAENALITNPIPGHMVYKAGSASGSGTHITFSVDNGKSYNIPAKLFVFDASGRKYPAGPKDYTHIRWAFENPLPSGAKGTVSFRAILE
jgi:uncharacterized repeat protein (TIGR01451 family)